MPIEHGRLALLGGQRLMTLFSHYNNFGLGGKPDGHTGGTLLSFNVETGAEEKCASAWFCSHSLDRSMVFDPRMGQVAIAQLGDAFPVRSVHKMCRHAHEGHEMCISIVG